MTKSRILWGVFLLFSIILFIWSNEYFMLCLVIGAALLPVLMSVLAHQAIKGICCELSTGVTCLQGEELPVMLTVENKGLLPVNRLRVRLEGENLLTGEVFHRSIRAGIGGREKKQIPLSITCRQCGTLRFCVSGFVSADAFGLKKYEKDAAVTADALVVPDIYPVETEILYGENLSLDSDEYSMRKPGSDPSETFSIREYRPGDKISQVHWKLSEKMAENLLIREHGLPIQNTILLLLESGYMPGTDAPDIDCMELLGKLFISVASELLDQGITFTAACFDHKSHSLSIMEISDEAELGGSMSELLSGTPGEDTQNVLEHILEDREQFPFAHLVVCSPYHIPELSELAGYTLVTEILGESSSTGHYAQDGINIYSFSPETVSDEIIYLEI